MAKQVVAYIDGHNLYHGIVEKKWQRLLWLNVYALVTALLKPGQVLVKTKYFTARVSGPEDKRLRQSDFLDALSTISEIEVFEGRFQRGSVECYQCGHIRSTNTEKRSDVNIAAQLMIDAAGGEVDVAILITGDSDLVPAVEAAKVINPSMRVVVAFPPARVSKELIAAAEASFHISRVKLEKSQFPETVSVDGHTLKCPKKWRA